MCGIVAYNGKNQAYSILIRGLKKLEYRGYDSTGISIITNKIQTYKRKGKVKDLEDFVSNKEVNSTIGIGHTRWATHGAPSHRNSHPHTSGDGKIVLAHNGIIENYDILKSTLEELGHTFNSDTDTEVLVHLIEEYKNSDSLTTRDALIKALNKVVGAYAIVLMDSDVPDTLYGARKSSPLVLGIGDNEHFLGSDATPIVEYTDQVVYLEDEQIVEIEKDKGYKVYDLDTNEVQTKVHKIDIKIEELEKGGYDHFMLKEIFQQPHTILESMRGRINEKENWVHVGGMAENIDRFLNVDRIIFAACGTSWHAALIGEYLIEELARIPVEVEYASEFRYRNPILGKKDVVIVLSQSGETADTLAALELAKSSGAMTYGIVNVVGSSIARMTESGSYIHSGPEIGVASTKAFTSMLTLLSLIAIQLGRERKTLAEERYKDLIQEFVTIPSKVREILKLNDKIKYVSAEIKSAQNALYLGRGCNFPIALEGALKLKEISYIHAEGYPAAEMKHGPIALIDLYMPVIIIATNKSAYSKIISNIEEVKARKGTVIAIVDEDDTRISDLADFTITIPSTQEIFSPLLSIVPLQLLSYHIAVMRGCHVDQPRNLAKSVTVE
ncbi:MAG: glutamine--fructose-6-phosphate transaminase (isomerizing) [Saprospiraceae bacterium]